MSSGINHVKTPLPEPAAKCPGVSLQLESAVELLLEGDFQTRWEATKQLLGLGLPAIARLISLLNDDDLDWEIRWFAARALGQFQDEAAMLALMQLLQQSHEPDLIAIAAEGLSRHGEAGINALAQLAEAPEYRLTAIQALASIRHKSALPPLLIAVQDDHLEVRVVALSALGNFRDPRVDQQLIEAIQDPVAAVRQEAITHLGRRSHLLTTTPLIDILEPSLWDIDPAVANATAIALGRLGTESAMAILARVLTSPHTPEFLQITIVKALSWIQTPSALVALLAARLRLSPSVQVELINTLPQLDDIQLRQQAGAALCSWLDDLLSSSELNSVKQAIAFSLGCLHYQPARPLLHALAQLPDEPTRLHAEAALRQLTKLDQ